MSYTYRRKVDGRVYLEERESYRVGGKVRNRFLRYLGVEGETPGSPRRELDRVTHGPSRRAGAVRLLWSLAEDLQFRPLIRQNCTERSEPGRPSAAEYLTIWAINRVLDPDSATQLGPWVATTDLPLLAGFPEEMFTKDDFLRALDTICYDDPALAQVVDHTRELDTALTHRWRELHPLPKGAKEVLAYDLTNVLFFGVTCPIAAVGHNPDYQIRPQVNVAVVVSRHDHAPIFQFVYKGNRNGGSTVRNLLVELQRAQIPPGLLIADRGIVGRTMVGEVRGMGWHLLGGVSKSSKEVRAILHRVTVPETPGTYVTKTRVGGVYAVKARAELWGGPREVVVYANGERAQRDREERNRELSEIGRALTTLSEKGAEWPEGRLHSAIEEVVGSWTEFLDIRVKRGGVRPRIAWRFRERAVNELAKQDGKYVLICTDEQMSAAEVVEAYLGKDFVEKVFRTLKTTLELEPVRHRRERRVRAYLWVCELAYRLEVALRQGLIEGGVRKDLAEHQERLLEELARVERVEIQLGAETRTWYLNVTDRVKEDLRRLKKKDLLQEGSGSAAAV